jgi:two-component system chemotaxis response regulator CheB
MYSPVQLDTTAVMSRSCQSRLPSSAQSTPLFERCAFDLVVLGASLGGVRALKDILAALPATFPAAIGLVQHSAAHPGSLLCDVLGYGSRLPVRFAEDGERLRAGTAYVARPGRHLLVSPSRCWALNDSDKINHARPAIDLLFQSASAAFGPRVLAVVLSGMGRDGAAGAATVKQNGGTLLVQDIESAEAPGMPRATMGTVSPDLVLPLGVIANALISLVAVPGGMSFFGLPIAAKREPVAPL